MDEHDQCGGHGEEEAGTVLWVVYTHLGGVCMVVGEGGSAMWRPWPSVFLWEVWGGRGDGTNSGPNSGQFGHGREEADTVLGGCVCGGGVWAGGRMGAGRLSYVVAVAFCFPLRGRGGTARTVVSVEDAVARGTTWGRGGA